MVVDNEIFHIFANDNKLWNYYTYYKKQNYGI